MLATLLHLIAADLFPQMIGRNESRSTSGEARLRGDIVTALTAAGFVVADLGRKAHEKISDWKERHGGHG